jgi:glycosyltransferase involved in cell wall biosynthesis
MKIAVLTSYWDETLLTEGIARVVYELRKIWTAQGHTIHLYAYNTRHDPDQGIFRIPIPLIPLTSVWMNAWLTISRRLHGYDILFPQSALLCLFLDRKRCVPLVHTLSSVEHKVPWRFWRYAYGSLERAALKGVPTCFALSDDTVETLRQRHAVPASSILKITNGVDYETFKPDPGRQPAAFTIFSAGRFVPRKRFDILIRAYALIAASHDEPRLVIAGAGPLDGELKDLVARLGIKPGVEFTGPVDTKRMVDLYQTSSIFALASEAEGMPLVVLEAQSCGLPAVISGFASAGEVVEDGQTGFVVRDDSPEAWAEAFASLHREPELMGKMARRARERIVARFGWDNVASQIMAAFQQVQGAGN